MIQNTLLSCVTSTNKEGGHNDTKHIVILAKCLHCVRTACALRAYCARRG